MRKTNKPLISIVLILILGVLAILPAAATADAEAVWNEEMQAYIFNQPHYGIVICTQLNVRQEAKTNSKSLGKIKNGQPVKVIGITEKSDFYLLDLASCGIASQEGLSYGFVKSGLIKIDPEYIFVQKMLYLYASPWDSSPTIETRQTPKLRNGEQDNRYYLVIDQSERWYAIQATEERAGSAFVRIKDVPINAEQSADPKLSGQYVTPTKYVVTWEAPLLDETMSQIDTVKKYTPGEIAGEKDEFLLLILNKGQADERRGYINKLYLAPVIN